MAPITMKNLTKVYGDGFHAVKDVDLDIGDGEFVILVGPSGCGKSTLLRMIVGLEDITDGELLIDGEQVNEKAPRDRNLAMVFQNYALYPHLTVYENIAFPLRLAKVDDKELDQRVRKASDVLELDEHLERKPANLSGGQRQRVAMGRAIVRDAKAFLFDEPLSNLDAKLRGQMRTEISRLQKRLGITTVYVTHDQVEAMTLGDRVAVLRKGALQQVAAPRELYEQPVNLFVAGFIGSPPMNFLPAKVSGGVAETPFGEARLTPEMAERVGERDMVILGARPEHFEDASVVDDALKDKGMTFPAQVDVIEWLGNEQYAYVPFEAADAVEKQLEELDRELDGEAMRTQLVVSLDGASRIAEGEEAQLWLDMRRVHFFDPESGDNLTLREVDDTTGRGSSPRESQERAEHGTEGRHPAERRDPADASADDGSRAASDPRDSSENAT
jgi:multiple sugar transport system ATP-binding protein